MITTTGASVVQQQPPVPLEHPLAGNTRDTSRACSTTLIDCVVDVARAAFAGEDVPWMYPCP